MTTPIFELPEWAAAMASPWVAHNTSVRLFEALIRGTVVDRDLSAPPGSCDDGAAYLVKATATDAWADHDGELAVAVGEDAVNGWLFATVAVDGARLWVADEAAQIQYSASLPGWEVVTPDFPEAPEDGKTYGRKDAAWSEIPDLSGVIPLADGGTGASLAAPGATRLLGWNAETGTVDWFALDAGLTEDDGSIGVENPTSGGFATANRWRVRTVQAGSGGGVGWGEISFHDAAVAQIAPVGTASASTEASGNEASEAFDFSGGSGNGWRYDGVEPAVGSWIEFNFTTPAQARYIRLTPITGAYDEAPEQFAVEYYNGTSWITVLSITREWISNDIKQFTLGETPAAPPITGDGGEFDGPITVPDDPYDATSWNGSLEVPTKNAIRDKIESMSSGALLAANNLSDLDDVATAQTNLGFVVLADQAAYDALDPPIDGVFYFVPEES